MTLWPAAVPSGLTQVGASFLLLLSTIWPFHHKKPAFMPDGICLGCDEKPGSPIFHITATSDCTLQDDLYFYVAEDGTISFSHAGCEAAKTNVETARTFNQFGSRKI